MKTNYLLASALTLGVSLTAFGDVQIVSKISDQCLNIENTVRHEDLQLQTPVIQWPCEGTRNERFRIHKNSDGSISIESVKSGKYLDVPRGSVTSGLPLEQWDWNGGPGQRFNLVPLEDGYVAIKPVSGEGNLCLDIDNTEGSNAHDPGTKLIQFGCQFSWNQQFKIKPWRQ